jgi:hypothetical protein
LDPRTPAIERPHSGWRRSSFSGSIRAVFRVIAEVYHRLCRTGTDDGIQPYSEGRWGSGIVAANVMFHRDKLKEFLDMSQQVERDRSLLALGQLWFIMEHIVSSSM